MLIHMPSQRVVLNLSNPQRVTTVIPTARLFDYKGSQLVAVPHRLDETRVLRNLGIRAPSPILHHYSWPGQYNPFFAQSETAQFLTLNPKAFVLNDMGTGKTLAALWAFDYLRSVKLAAKMLVISPLSTLERTWADEVFKHFPHLDVAVLHGTKDRRLKQLDEDRDIYLINHHGIGVIEKELIAKGFDTIVVDEGAVFRNASTALWKSLNRIASPIERIWWMTGTPTPNAPTDAWAQCRIVCPERVPKFFGKFRDMVMRQMGQFKWLARDNATEIVAEAMQPAVRFTRDQCVDLPPTIPMPRHAPMSPEQAKAYKEMLSKLTMEFQGDAVQAVNEAVKMSKLVQIACGVVYGLDGQEVVLPSQSRIDVVKEIIEDAAAKVIVFVPYKAVMRHVADTLSKDFTVSVISGDTPKAERDRIFADFQNERGGAQVLVAQPAAMSHGLTLVSANVVCWYAPVTSNEIYEQANARVTRPGQKHTTWIAMIEGSAVERRIYERLQGKQKMQGLLLETVKGAA